MASTPRAGPPATRSPTSPSPTRTRLRVRSTTSHERNVRPVTATTQRPLELDDIQAGALFERPSPYVGTYLLLRIDQRADGRELVRRLERLVNPASSPPGGAPDTSLTVAFTYSGLQALGVPQQSLDSFAPEFREGMAARAAALGD